MTIEFNCPNCQKLLRTADEKAGLQAKCPDCGNPVSVPQAASSESDAYDMGDDSQAADSGYNVASSSSSSPPPSGGSGTKACPMCGEQIKAAAVRCRYCGEDIGGGGAAPMGGPADYMKPHRATMLLVFSILGWAVCLIFGIVAFVMANGDLKEMEAGVMDPSGEGMTKAAKIVSLVQLCFMGVVLVIYCGIFMVAIASGGF